MTGKNATEVLVADAAGIARAAQVLRDGGLVAVPTETVYGLAARADDPAAVAKIYAAKGRPDFNPLIIHVFDIAQADAYVEFDTVSKSLAQAYWPGPLTLVLPRRAEADLAPAVTAGLPTLAVRAPAHPVMQALLESVTFPLAAPSANRSGFISPTCAAHVLASLDGRIDLVLDGGPCKAGLESTIVAVRAAGEIDVLRPGPIDLGAPVTATGQVEAPGQLASHYAPGKPVRLGADRAEPDEFFIGFGPMACDCNLSESADPEEAAHRLYACLHQGAEAAHPRIAVAPVPERGVGRAVNDRLRRAAA